MTRTMAYGVAILGLCLGSCGSEGTPVITGEVTSVQKMPFHGPNGPGTEPISITFRWTTVVRATGGSDCVVQSIRTQLTETQSGVTVEADIAPDQSLPDGQPVQFPQQQGGVFSSALYDRPWNGHSQVKVGCTGGEHQQVGVSFTVP